MTTRTICEIRRDAKRVSDAVRLDQIYLTALYFDADEQFADSQYRVETSLRVRGERRSESVVVVFSRHESVARKEDMDSDSPTSWRATVDHEARFDVTASVDDAVSY